MVTKEVRLYLAKIGRRGGQAGQGKAKIRGDVAYYRRISKLAAKARAGRRAKD